MQSISWEPENYIAPRSQEIQATDSRIPPHALSTLIVMLRSLVNESEHRLGQPVTAAAVSMPCRNAINHWGSPVADLVREAFSWIGLEYLEIVSASYYGEPLLYPENVVLAGHGLGLCQPYTSPYSCLDDESQLLPGVSYFLVGHHANALEVIITSTTYVAYGVTPGNFLDYNLGAEARHRNPDEEYYWEQVRQLLHIPLIRRKLETPSKLVYYGDYSDDIHLRTVVREVMRSFLDEDDMPETVADGIDPVFAGAFGAAEFAKRKPYWDKKDQQSVVSVAPKSDL